MSAESGRYSGRKTRYQRKYCEVQTLLKATNARVWASIVRGRSRFARAIGMRTVDSRSCGTNAKDSNEKEELFVKWLVD